MNYIVAGAGGEMLAQVMGGHLTVATGGLNEMAQQIQAGKLRALGISSPERLPGVDIPTFKEQGLDVDTGQLARPDGAGQDEAAPRRRRSTRPWGRWSRATAGRRCSRSAAGSTCTSRPTEFAAFLGPERARIEGILKDVGLVQ